MSRKRVPKGQVFLKKDEKINKVILSLDKNFSEKEFIEKFKEIYPNDWEKRVKRYEAHQNLTPTGKTHPMPNPYKYLSNALKTSLKRLNKQQSLTNNEKNSLSETIAP